MHDASEFDLPLAVSLLELGEGKEVESMRRTRRRLSGLSPHNLCCGSLTKHLRLLVLINERYYFPSPTNGRIVALKP